MSEIKVNFEARQELEKLLGAGHMAYCYQCGACVGDCPSARFYPGFNPRKIMLNALIGNIDKLTAEDSDIWLCSNCYNCYERCPQDVHPVEVIIALKNLAAKEGKAANEVTGTAQRIRETGRSVPVMPATNKMRERLGLEPLPEIDMQEINTLLNTKSRE